MSHFTVLVVLPKETPLEGVQAKLDEVLAPFDENAEAEPYRKYDDAATPAMHWQYKYVYAEALPAPDAPPVTWEQYLPALNEHNGGDERMSYDPELDRVYHLSTYNPLSKWDWWQIGGRWANSLLAKPTVDVSALLTTAKHWTEEHGNTIKKGRGVSGGIWCDAARLCDLDLEAMRAAKVAEATEAYDHFAATIGEHLSTTLPWSHFYELGEAGAYTDQVEAAKATAVGDEADRIAWRDFAREAYREQRGIVRLNEVERYRFHFGCTITTFKLGREAYIEQEANNFLPGYAMVTLDGQWLAQGEMGWFGMGSDTDGTKDSFKIEAMQYLRTVDQESVAVLVDCHI